MSESAARLLGVLDNHQSNVNRPAWSPNGSFLATPDDAGLIRIWDFPKLRMRHLLRDSTVETGRVYGAAWSPDSRLLATAMDDEIVRVWHAARECIDRQLDAGGGRVHTVAWCKKTLAAGARDGSIRLWNTSTWRPIGRLEGHTDWVNSLAWSPDGRWLASAGGDRDKTVRVWCMDRAKELWKGYHDDFVLTVAWSPDGRWVISGSNDRSIRVWNAATGDLLRTVAVHADKVKCVAVSHDGALLASKSQDGTVKLLSTETWGVRHTIDEPAAGRWAAGLAFHPTLPVLATLGVKETNKDVSIRIWDVGHAI